MGRLLNINVSRAKYSILQLPYFVLILYDVPLKQMKIEKRELSFQKDIEKEIVVR